jgi:hypothetical protein
MADAELTGGKFFLEVKYNGKVIYNKDWELCTLDEDYDDRIVYCPFNPGDHSFVKDRQIPIYLPKVCICLTDFDDANNFI